MSRMIDDTLRRRDRIRLAPGGPIYIVEYVNSCRAHCRQETGQTVTIGDRSFEATGRTTDIAPTAIVQIISRDRRIRKAVDR